MGARIIKPFGPGKRNGSPIKRISMQIKQDKIKKGILGAFAPRMFEA
jgi:hypothetical protein